MGSIWRGIVKALAWTDGGNRTNIAGSAFVIAKIDGTIIEERSTSFEGKWTNNDMEMHGILSCIERCLELNVTDLTLHSDSEWCVRILLEEYRLKQEKFRAIVDRIWDLGRSFDRIEIKHIRRERNARADWHCRGATDQTRRAHPPALALPS